MIAIHGNIKSNDISLISKLKKYFEADEVMLNWNGKDEADKFKTTLAITNMKPPYKTNCSIISLDDARRLLNA